MTREQLNAENNSLYAAVESCDKEIEQLRGFGYESAAWIWVDRRAALIEALNAVK